MDPKDSKQPNKTKTHPTPNKIENIKKEKSESQKMAEQMLKMYGNGYQKGTHIYKSGYGWVPRDDNFEHGY